MRHYIVFHADVDGVICAAMFMKSKLKQSDKYRLYPVFSSIRGQRFLGLIEDMKLNTDDKLYVFDFEYHKRANLWIDHHPNIKFGSQKVTNAKMRYCPFARSAASLIFEDAEFGEGKNGNMKKLIDQVNMVDSAGYEDVNYIFTNNDPIMILRSVLEQTPPTAYMTFCRVVEIIANTDFDLEEVVSRLNLDKTEIDNLRSKAKQSKKHLTIHGNISVIRQKRVAEFPRYSECYIKPDIRYNVRLTPIYKKQLIQIGYNRWHDQPNDLNIGKFMAELPYVQGGGHFHVGGGTVERNDVEKFLDDLSIVTKNEEETTMEKYGVDKEDKVEKEAEEMVKKGEKKDMDEARESVSEGETDGGNSDTGSNTGNETGDSAGKENRAEEPAAQAAQ